MLFLFFTFFLYAMINNKQNNIQNHLQIIGMLTNQIINVNNVLIIIAEFVQIQLIVWNVLTKVKHTYYLIMHIAVINNLLLFFLK